MNGRWPLAGAFAGAAAKTATPHSPSATWWWSIQAALERPDCSYGLCSRDVIVRRCYGVSWRSPYTDESAPNLQKNWNFRAKTGSGAYLAGIIAMKSELLTLCEQSTPLQGQSPVKLPPDSLVHQQPLPQPHSGRRLQA
jgi:hypothetical protein